MEFQSTLSKSSPFQIFVNGKLIQEDYISQEWSLAHYLREILGLCGTKVACGVGGCGSCTVLVSKFYSTGNKIRHVTMNACITPLASVAESHILTIEGLSTFGNNKCHVIQDAIARNNGTQCGFCTPGMVMSMYGLCHVEKNPSVKSIKTSLQGNLCRCTGYRPIIEAFKHCSEKQSGCTPVDIEELAATHPNIEGKRDVYSDTTTAFKTIEDILHKFSTESNNRKLNVNFKEPNIIWSRPDSLEKFVKILQAHPNAKVIAGSTSNELQPNIRETAKEGSVFVETDSVKEMKVVEVKESSIVLGAALTITELMEELQKVVEKNPAEEKIQGLKVLVKRMQQLGSIQIRNAATIGGSLMTKFEASDVQTWFTGFGVLVYVVDPAEGTGAKKVSLPIIKRDQIILSVEIPFNKKNEYCWAQKVSRRKDCDAPVVNAAFKVQMSDNDVYTVKDLFLTFGGTSVNRFSANYSYNVTAKHLNEKFVSEIKQEISLKIAQSLNSSSYSSEYVSILASSLFMKFFRWLKHGLSESGIFDDEMDDFDVSTFKSTRLYSLVDDGQLNTDLIGKPVPHASAYKHATGEAKFCDDTPKLKSELELAFVLSTRAHAAIKNIDATKAIALEGVVGFVSHEDLPKERNIFGLVIKDEEIFASTKVTCVGQIIGGVVANDRQVATRAAKLVEIEYEDLQPLILTMEDAIQHNSYYDDFGMKLAKGDCAKIFENSPHVITDEVTVGSVEHFYMEPQSCIAIPKGEDGEMDIISSTQNPMQVQLEVARMLGVPANHVVTRVKRVGGGFGGKESRCMLVALPVAAAAKKFGKPVRCILDRETDMIISGKRHAFLTRHKIAYDDEGRLLALQMKLYCNGGNSLDVSVASIERAIINLDNAYNIPNVDLDGYICKTNIPSNTVFRGTGGPQGVFLIENIMDHIASAIQKDPIEVRKLNMYNEGDITPYGQPLINYTIQKCWDECIRLSDYQERKDKVDSFNKKNKWRKRGIAVTPCSYGIAYTAVHLNQGAALVHIYTDGSVIVSHAGVEIGQGVHSKMIQVATRELGIPASKIRILETATDKVPNSTPSSASMTTDLNGPAVMNACKELMQRLQPYKTENLNETWEEIVNKAYFDRVSLSATGFYKVPENGWNEERRGSPFGYFSTGAACSEVEIDCLTGQYQILRTDIVMDVGKSLNPAIDVGQIEGAFMQGVGLYALEELIMDESGKLLTTGPNTYKIPTAADTPLEFNVSLLPGSGNPKAIYSSKAVGEPPLLLAPSVFFAIKDGIRAYRKEAGMGTNFHVNSPITVEKILLSCRSA